MLHLQGFKATASQGPVARVGEMQILDYSCSEVYRGHLQSIAAWIAGTIAVCYELKILKAYSYPSYKHLDCFTTGSRAAEGQQFRKVHQSTFVCLDRAAETAVAGGRLPTSISNVKTNDV